MSLYNRFRVFGGSVGIGMGLFVIFIVVMAFFGDKYIEIAMNYMIYIWGALSLFSYPLAKKLLGV